MTSYEFLKLFVQTYPEEFTPNALCSIKFCCSGCKVNKHCFNTSTPTHNDYARLKKNTQNTMYNTNTMETLL